MKEFPFFLRFLRHRLRSGNRRGFGIHSPFLFSLVTEVIGNSGYREVPADLKKKHKELSRDKRCLNTGAFGAGSKVLKASLNKVSDIVKGSSVSPKWGSLLFRLVQWYRPTEIIELGTGLGLSTAYLARGGNMNVVSVEASGEKCNFARNLMEELGIRNVRIIPGTFDKELPELSRKAEEKTLWYIDGNHTSEATLKYADMILKKGNTEALLVFDDINWSEGMYSAWTKLMEDERITVSADLFFMGILIVREGMQKASLKLVF